MSPAACCRPTGWLVVDVFGAGFDEAPRCQAEQV